MGPTHRRSDTNLIERLAADPRWREIQSRLEENGASDAFIRGTLQRLARIPDELRFHDRHFGTDRENRARRSDLAQKLRKLARASHLDADAKILTVLELDNEPGPYRVQWLNGLHRSRPTIARVLEEAAEQLETKPGLGTVKLPRDVVLRVAFELHDRLTIAATLAGKRAPAWPHAAIASISSILIGEPVQAAAAKKIVERAIQRERQKPT